MSWLFIIAFIFLVTEFIFMWLDLGGIGFFGGLIFIGIPLYFLFKRDAKYIESETSKRQAINKSNLILLYVIGFAQLVIYPPLLNYSIDKEAYVKLKEKYEEREYRSVISTVLIDQKSGLSFPRADKLKEEAIKKWIGECKASGESTCINEIFDLASIDIDLEYAAKEKLNFNKEKYYEKEEQKEKLIYYLEPIYGLEEKFINQTSWGVPTKRKIIGNSNSSYISYNWNLCKDNKQISRTAEVLDGKVVTVYTASTDISELRPEHVNCPE